MLNVDLGPSANAWGVLLVDSVMVRHDGRQVLFARAANTPTEVLYYRVLDPSVSANAAIGASWNGWYRVWLPQARNLPPHNADASSEGRQPELRVAGMDLLTVPPLSTTQTNPADAPFRVIADGQTLRLFRPSAHGTIYMDQLLLVATVVDVGRGTEQRFSMAVAWEVRFKRSGLRDIPLNDTDGPGYRDSAGLPFPAPTVEFRNLGTMVGGLFDVAMVPTNNTEVSQLYFLVAEATAFQLTRVQVNNAEASDYAVSQVSYTPWTPSLKLPAATLGPIAGLAPSLAFYGEQETEANPQGETAADVARAARLAFVLPVAGGGLTAAAAVLDFAVGLDGSIPDLPAADQVIALVDGDIVAGSFVADTTEVFYPAPSKIAETQWIIGGLPVSGLVLGQVQPHTSPFLKTGEDGLLHLYFGGAIPDVTDPKFSHLIAGMPQAMVAQCDVRVTRYALAVSWIVHGRPDETGSAVFRARIPGSLMSGTSVVVTDFTGPTTDDICDITITAPAATGFPDDVWTGLPRDLKSVMQILNGEATDDTADPNVLSGDRAYFDFSGTHPMVRAPLVPAPPVGPSSKLIFVGTYADLPITQVVTTATSAVLTLIANGKPVTITWPSLPQFLSAARDIFDGAAGADTYGYPETTSDTAIYALETSTFGVNAPVILYQSGATKPTVSLQVVADSAHPGMLELQVTPAPTGAPFDDLPADVAGFTTALKAHSGWAGLELAIATGSAAGKVAIMATASGPITLAEKAALFDVLITPGATLSALSLDTATTAAIIQKHDITGYDLTKAIAVYVTSLQPESGLPASIENGQATVVSGALKDVGWVRQTQPKACTFDGTDAAVVPVSIGTTLIQNLTPQREWTVESWIKPARADYQRMLTFDGGTTPLRNTDPIPQYSLATEGQEVIEFATFVPPAAGIGSFFQTGTSPAARVMPKGAFTLECWVQPDAAAALDPVAGTTRYGGIFQLGNPTQNPFLSLVLMQDRTVYIQTTNTASQVTYQATPAILPATDLTSGEAVWSHMSLIGRQDSTTKLWTLDVLVDGLSVKTFLSVDLQDQTNAQIIIGRHFQADSSFFGRMAQLRYWNVARPINDIRRTWRTSMTGNEPGLLGDWPMDGLKSNGGVNPQSYLRNSVTLTATNWNSVLNQTVQGITAPRDSFFLSLITSVGGLPSVEFDARLASNEWNHVALSFETGGGLAMNPQSQYDLGIYDWAQCTDSSALGTASKFAIDAWINVPAGQPGEIGTIIAQWAPHDLVDDRGYRLWIDAEGELNFMAYAVSDIDGTMVPVTTKSSGWALEDGLPHHIAVTVDSRNADNEATPRIDASFTVTLFKDGVPATPTNLPLPDVQVAQFQASEATVTIGRSYAPLTGAAPQAAEDFAPLRATLGRIQYWATLPTVAQLFPEHQSHVPQYGPAKGLTAQWNFREGEGHICVDRIGGNDLQLNSSRPWSVFPQTSEMAVISNGAYVGTTSPYTTVQPAPTSPQFTIGLPSGWTGPAALTGFEGQVAELSLYGTTRSTEEIRSQRFIPRAGDEPRLLASWNFTVGTDDITGGQNNISPVPAPSRIVDANAPISNESPVVRNVYGGPVTRFSGSTPGRIAVGSFAVGRDIGTDDQHAALLREYILDPADILEGGVQIGVLNLIYLGQVQTNATLIGFIEGAPPVPSENLTRPYYLNVGSPGYMAYLDTATVALKQEAGTAMSFSSSSTQAFNIASDWAIGLIKVKSHVGLITGLGVSTATNVMDHTVNFQAKFAVDGSWGSGSGEELSAAWTSEQSDYMGFSGGWEGFQKNPDNYFNPDVGRRFVPDNLGYALVESLTADQFALALGKSKSASGILTVPNPAIPPDRNIVLFPMDNTYTQAGTLDGKIGLKNAPEYPDADIRRGSYFKPVEAYSKAKRIETRRARSLAYYEQRDVVSRAHGWNADVADATTAAPASFEGDPEGPLAVATPTQGLVNRYVWTADGGLYSETHAAKAAYTKSFTGTRGQGGGGGFHIAGEHSFAKVGLAWSLDLMITNRIDLTTQKSLEESQQMSLDVAVAGEAYLSKFDPAAQPDYGGTGNFLPGAAPGKVKAYRFMTLYDPPSMQNSSAFEKIIDPAWLRNSNAPMAQALRSANMSNPTWRIMHRVTYVERVPPPVSSRPIFNAVETAREPVNVPGNAELIALILAQVPQSTALSRDVLNRAIAAAINPLATSPGVYPTSALENQLQWWGAFLQSARPGAQNAIPDAAAAAVLRNVSTNVNQYMISGVNSGVISLP